MPDPFADLSQELSRLPGFGRRSAERAALVADKLSQVASLSESEADRRRAELSDILYHLTN